MNNPNMIDVAVLGLGEMGQTHVEAAQSSPFIRRIYGYEPDVDRAKSRAAELGIDAIGNLEEILQNPAIKLIYIASVNEAHAEQTIRALQAGKAVLCEKPMGISLMEAKRMLDAEKQTGSFLQIGFELHYSKLYQQAKEWISQGLIGTPLNCHCRYYCSEFHLKNTWRSRSKGTLIGEKLSHYLDLQKWFFDDLPETIYSVCAPNAVQYFNHPDNHQIITRYRRGGVASLNFIMHLAETDHTDPLLEMLEKQSDDGHSLQYHICGDKGAIETDVFRRRIRRWEFSDSPKQLLSEIVETITFPKEEDQVYFHNVRGQNLRVAELVARNLPPENTAQNAFDSMRMCFASEVSFRENRVVNFNEI